VAACRVNPFIIEDPALNFQKATPPITRIAPIQGSDSGIVRAIRVIRGFFDPELG
jgi:hypothetical protein